MMSILTAFLQVRTLHRSFVHVLVSQSCGSEVVIGGYFLQDAVEVLKLTVSYWIHKYVKRYRKTSILNSVYSHRHFHFLKKKKTFS